MTEGTLKSAATTTENCVLASETVAVQGVRSLASPHRPAPAAAWELPEDPRPFVSEGSQHRNRLLSGIPWAIVGCSCASWD